MLSYTEIREALARHLKKHFKEVEVHFDNVERANKDYFYLEISERQKHYTEITFERTLDIDIMLVFHGEMVKRATVYGASEKLNDSFGAVFKIKDRFLTLGEKRSNLVDDILHYHFALSFADSYEGNNAHEFMQELHFKEA